MNHYELLQIPKNATTEEVLAAYRFLAKKYHPDVCKEKDANENFKKIVEAYEVLSDNNKRAIYNSKLPKVKPQINRGSGIPRNPDGSINYAVDPNLGNSTIHDLPPRKVDVWGEPIYEDSYDEPPAPAASTSKSRFVGTTDSA